MSAQNQSGNAVNATTILADLPVEEQELTASEKMQVVGGMQKRSGAGETGASKDDTNCESDSKQTGTTSCDN